MSSPPPAIAGTEIGQRGVQGRLVGHVDDAGPEPLGAKLAAQFGQAVVVAVHRTDSPALGVEQLCALAAHSAARAGDEDGLHPSTTALMRCSVLVMSRMLRRLRSQPPKSQKYTLLNADGVIRNDSVTSVPPPAGANL